MANIVKIKEWYKVIRNTNNLYHQRETLQKLNDPTYSEGSDHEGLGFRNELEIPPQVWRRVVWLGYYQLEYRRHTTMEEEDWKFLYKAYNTPLKEYTFKDKLPDYRGVLLELLYIYGSEKDREDCLEEVQSLLQGSHVMEKLCGLHFQKQRVLWPYPFGKKLVIARFSDDPSIPDY